MRPIQYALAVVLIVAGTQTGFAAQSLQVTKSVKLDASAESVWKAVGEFCAISDWHPAVAKCEISKEGDATFRTLTLGDGAKIKEKHNGSNPTGYMYAIIESPLPVKDYNALFDVTGDDKSATIEWSASFLANGKPDGEVKEQISGIFDGGLKAIKEKLSKK
jgi:Polyketide cyclase / dehydrase and lipid transport